MTLRFSPYWGPPGNRVHQPLLSTLTAGGADRPGRVLHPGEHTKGLWWGLQKRNINFSKDITDPCQGNPRGLSWSWKLERSNVFIISEVLRGGVIQKQGHLTPELCFAVLGFPTSYYKPVAISTSLPRSHPANSSNSLPGSPPVGRIPGCSKTFTAKACFLC